MRTLLTATLLAGAAWGCAGEAPDRTAMFNQAELRLVGGSNEEPTPTFHARLAAAIDGASARVDVAVERLNAPAVTDALIRAAARGVAVRVVSDQDAATDPGFAALSIGGIVTTFGDGEIPWSPQPGVEMVRPGSDNQMTHNFVVIDEVTVWNWTGGLLPDGEAGLQSVVEIRSQDVAKDFRSMHQQMVGGTFATTLTAYGAMTSATNDSRLRYVIAEPWTMELQFAPAEPAIKQIIDEVYAARASVWISASYLWNRPLTDALRYKAAAGFDVRVVVDGRSQASAYDQSRRLGQIFDELREADAAFPTLVSVDRTLDTFVIIDGAVSPIDLTVYPRLAMWASHGALPASPFTIGDAGPVSRPSGAFTDGNFWAFREEPGFVAPPIDALVQRFNRILQEEAP